MGRDRRLMPRLLERIRRLRHRRRPSPPPRKLQRHERLWTAFYVVLGLAVVLGGYFWLTTARLLKEPLRVDYGPSDPAFVSAMGPLVGAEFMPGNKIETLVNGDEFFPAMLQAIAAAQKTITLESYIWSSGYISNQFIAALSERARAGVKVHVIVDGMGTLKLNHSDRERMRDAGIEIYGYGREHWYQVKPDINHRTHRKLLIVDGKVVQVRPKPGQRVINNTRYDIVLTDVRDLGGNAEMFDGPTYTKEYVAADTLAPRDFVLKVKGGDEITETSTLKRGRSYKLVLSGRDNYGKLPYLHLRISHDGGKSYGPESSVAYRYVGTAGANVDRYAPTFAYVCTRRPRNLPSASTARCALLM